MFVCCILHYSRHVFLAISLNFFSKFSCSLRRSASFNARLFFFARSATLFFIGCCPPHILLMSITIIITVTRIANNFIILHLINPKMDFSQFNKCKIFFSIFAVTMRYFNFINKLRQCTIKASAPYNNISVSCFKYGCISIS